jgi:hypothetical protein
MDIHGRHSKNHSKLDECLTELQRIDNIVMKSQMWTFYNTTRRCWSAMDKEFVECRRTRKLTIKYTELESDLDECVKEFHRWTLMALLMQK